MASIQINRGTKAEIDNTPIVDGLISFQTDDNFIYMDNGDTREAFGGVKVIPNPEEQPTEVLRNLQIADDVYKISGGHEIEDQSGDTLTQRDKMRFTGAYSHDDSTSEVTKIDIVREMTVSQKDSLSGDEIEGFQWTTDENDELPLTTDWVEYRDGQSATEAIDKCIKQVIDDGGDDLTNREDIQFEGVYTYDDDTEGSEKTVVSIVREFSTVAEIEALTGEAQKGFQAIINGNSYEPFKATDIGFNNTGTSFTSDDVDGVLKEVDDRLEGIYYSGNLDNLKTTGFYGIDVTSSSNAPSDVPNGSKCNITVNDASGLITQTLYYTSVAVYVRRFYNNSWNAWVKYSTTYTTSVTGTTSSQGNVSLDLSTNNAVVLSLSSAGYIVNLFEYSGGLYAHVRDTGMNIIANTSVTVNVTYMNK